jgi:hypothetical protein
VFQLLKVGQQQRVWYGVTQEFELLLYSSDVKSIIHLDRVFGRLNGQLLVDWGLALERGSRSSSTAATSHAYLEFTLPSSECRSSHSLAFEETLARRMAGVAHLRLTLPTKQVLHILDIESGSLHHASDWY